MNLPTLYLPGCPHEPTLKQRIALSLHHVRELLYGGAAGGGKSDFLLMAALQYIDVPGYSAVIFRRNFPQLAAPEDGLLARAQEWLEGHPSFEGRDTLSGMPTRWKYRGGGTLSFSHMQYERDKYNHQGPSYQFVGFDELTQFTVGQYKFLTYSRMRRLEGVPVPLRARGASNPGGEGHDWVREHFPIPRRRTDGTLEHRPQPKRLFLPAKLSDNPHLDRDEYEAGLMEMHPYERQQLLDGDWDARAPGSRFRREWFEVTEAAPEGMREVRRWDLAATEAKAGKDPDWTAGVRMGRKDGRYYVTDVQRFRGSPGAVDARLKQTAEMDGRGVAVRIEQEPGSSGKIAAAHFTRLLAGFDVRSVPSTGDKVVRANPLASQAEAGNVRLVRGPWLEEYLRELESFPEASHDDQVDASSGAFQDLTQSGLSPADLYGDDAGASA